MLPHFAITIFCGAPWGRAAKAAFSRTTKERDVYGDGEF